MLEGRIGEKTNMGNTRRGGGMTPGLTQDPLEIDPVTDDWTSGSV